MSNPIIDRDPERFGHERHPIHRAKLWLAGGFSHISCAQDYNSFARPGGNAGALPQNRPTGPVCAAAEALEARRS